MCVNFKTGSDEIDRIQQVVTRLGCHSLSNAEIPAL